MQYSSWAHSRPSPQFLRSDILNFLNSRGPCLESCSRNLDFEDSLLAVSFDDLLKLTARDFSRKEVIQL